MQATAVIVDDEPLAREIIQEYLGEFAELSVVAECENGRQAIRVINQQRPDLVFLDIQMPGLSGFEVIERLDYLPAIIFSTAHDEFALQAFDASAVDYLLKPYSRDRFRQAVRKALQQSPSNAATDRLLHLLTQSHARAGATFPDRLFVRAGQKIVPVAVRDILWIEAAGDYAHLHTRSRTFLSSCGIGELEKRLDPARFTRIHRSTIVAVVALRELQSDGEGGYFATLVSGRTVRVSRSHAPKVRTLIV